MFFYIDGEHWSAQLLTENPYDEVGCLCHGGSWLQLVNLLESTSNMVKRSLLKIKKGIWGMDETKYLQAKQEVGNILKSMIVGFIGWGIIGAILGYIIYMTGGNISHLLGMVLIMGIGLMGMPYVWSKLPYAISSGNSNLVYC